MSIFPSSILLAIDGSEETESAIRTAVDLADTTGSELHVVFVGQLPNFLMRVKDLDVVIFDRLGVDRMLYDGIERESTE
ncbi:MAG TPA: universal stress protein, partial [Rubrobacter sp.]|nr:universal stress protein [Rubrobacter sp.]